MDYLNALYPIHRRRDEFTLVPYPVLIEDGIIRAINLMELPGFIYEPYGKHEIIVSKAMNERLLTAYKWPEFVRDKDQLWLTLTYMGYREELINEFGSMPRIKKAF